MGAFFLVDDQGIFAERRASPNGSREPFHGFSSLNRKQKRHPKVSSLLVDDQGAFAALKEKLRFSEPLQGSRVRQAKKNEGISFEIPSFFGGRSGTRTLGPLIKSQLLYQLS